MATKTPAKKASSKKQPAKVAPKQKPSVKAAKKKQPAKAAAKEKKAEIKAPSDFSAIIQQRIEVGGMNQRNLEFQEKIKQHSTALNEWHTIHIFGNGNAHIAGNNLKGVTDNKLKSLADLLANLATLQQKGTNVSGQFRSLNIFNGHFIDFAPADEKNKRQRFPISDVNPKYVNALAKELISIASK